MTMSSMLAETTFFDGVKDFINELCQPHWFLIISVAALVVFLAGYRRFTKPAVAGSLGALFTLFFLVSCLDSNFVLIVKKADNVPIVMMMFAIGFFLWLAFRQAAVNDERMEKGKPLREARA